MQLVLAQLYPTCRTNKYFQLTSKIIISIISLNVDCPQWIPRLIPLETEHVYDVFEIKTFYRHSYIVHYFETHMFQVARFDLLCFIKLDTTQYMRNRLWKISRVRPYTCIQWFVLLPYCIIDFGQYLISVCSVLDSTKRKKSKLQWKYA